jgi:hypothetical protein
LRNCLLNEHHKEPSLCLLYVDDKFVAYLMVQSGYRISSVTSII